MGKELSEGQKPETGSEKEDNREPKEPRNPEDRTNARPEDEAGEGGPQKSALPAWAVSLPPQLRDAVIRGDLEMVPSEYRELVRRYHLWLLEQERRETRGR